MFLLAQLKDLDSLNNNFLSSGISGVIGGLSQLLEEGKKSSGLLKNDFSSSNISGVNGAFSLLLEEGYIL